MSKQYHDKHTLRLHYKTVRQNLSTERRNEAEKRLYNYLLQWLEALPLQPKKKVLSYAPTQTEIHLEKLNQWLLERGCLALPKVDNEQLTVHAISSFDELQPGAFGILEPQTALISLDTLQVILTPALAFDPLMQRLGYGKGFYDRLFLSVPKDVEKVGLGFQEQLHPTPFTQEDPRFCLTHRFLF